MKTLALTTILSLLVPMHIFAQDIKNGTINMQQVILNVKEGQEARKSLEQEIKKKQDEWKKEQEKLAQISQELKEKGPLLSNEAKLKKQQIIQEKLMELRKSEMIFQNEVKQKEAAATQKIAIKVQKITEKLAKDQNLIAVYETNSSGLLYLSNRIDLTDKVIKEFEKMTNKKTKKINLSKKNPSKTSSLK